MTPIDVTNDFLGNNLPFFQLFTLVRTLHLNDK